MSPVRHDDTRARDPWGRGGSAEFRGGAIRGWVGSEIILPQRAFRTGSRRDRHFRSVAQWLARSAHNREVVGSIPTAASSFA
jgi:hypothetical protein